MTPSEKQLEASVLEMELPVFSNRPTHDAKTPVLTTTTSYSSTADSLGKPAPSPYDSDLEACATPCSSSTKNGTTTSVKPCPVWPGTRALQEQKRQAKRANSCNPLRGLDKWTKLWVKIVIAILIVGTAVGVGVGISKAVGGGIWKNGSS